MNIRTRIGKGISNLFNQRSNDESGPRDGIENRLVVDKDSMKKGSIERLKIRLIKDIGTLDSIDLHTAEIENNAERYYEALSGYEELIEFYVDYMGRSKLKNSKMPKIDDKPSEELIHILTAFLQVLSLRYGHAEEIRKEGIVKSNLSEYEKTDFDKKLQKLTSSRKLGSEFIQYHKDQGRRYAEMGLHEELDALINKHKNVYKAYRNLS